MKKMNPPTQNQFQILVKLGCKPLNSYGGATERSQFQIYIHGQGQNEILSKKERNIGMKISLMCQNWHSMTELNLRLVFKNFIWLANQLVSIPNLKTMISDLNLKELPETFINLTVS